MNMPLNAPPLRRLDATGPDFEAQYRALFARMADENAEIDARAADILRDVQQRGDAAVLDCTRKFDRLDVPDMAALEISQAELQAALAAITPEQRDALEVAATRVRRYHERQLQQVGRAGNTATKTARCSDRRSRRWTAWASMCPAARPPIPPRC